ncbi:MAG: hypothetical protein WCT37_00240 [Patescibacteria group bacterium]|jgi:hypothetical protein
MLLRIILGSIGMAIGFVVVWKSEWILQNFGGNAWAEHYLGSDGGSRLLYKLIGLGVIFISILYMTYLIDGILLAIFKTIFVIK